MRKLRYRHCSRAVDNEIRRCKTVGHIVYVINKNEVTLSITSFLGILQASSGTDRVKNHNFVITVTDNEDNMTTKTLMLQTGK